MVLSRRAATAFGTFAAIVSLGAAALLAAELQDYRSRDRFLGKDLIYLPSPVQARLMSLGFRQVVADYYWVKALQYFTDPANAWTDYRNLADYIDLVVEIDPDFEYAYKFGGFAIPYDAGRLRWKNTERSTRLLEKGVQRFPDNWFLHWLLGFNYLNFHQDYARAAEQFAIASRHPEAPTYLAGLAARVFSVGGDIDRAIAFTQETLQTAEEPEVRAFLEKRLLDLQVERELRRVEQAAEGFKQENGRLPKDLRELIEATGIAAPPPGYWLDETGTAHAPLDTERMRLHQDPQQLPFTTD